MRTSLTTKLYHINKLTTFLSAANLSTCVLDTILFHLYQSRNCPPFLLHHQFVMFYWIIPISAYKQAVIFPIKYKNKQKENLHSPFPLQQVCQLSIYYFWAPNISFIACSEKWFGGSLNMFLLKAENVEKKKIFFYFSSWHNVKLYQQRTLERHCRRKELCCLFQYVHSIGSCTNMASLTLSSYRTGSFCSIWSLQHGVLQHWPCVVHGS